MLGSKTGKSRSEQMFFGFAPKADLRSYARYALVAARPAEDNRRQNEKATLNASSRCRVSQQEAIVSSHTTTTAARHFCDAS